MRKELCLEGKTALITGGGTGLGFGIASELADAGANVILAGRRKDVLLKASAKLPGSHCRMLDLTRREELPAWVEALEKDLGPVDILVNNAGVQNNKPALEFTYEDLQSLYDVHVYGAYLLTKEIARSMVSRKAGAVVFITSAAAHMGLTNNTAYSGAKGALSAMVRSLASELSPQGVRVNAVAPGWIETELVRESLRRVPERRSMVERRILLDGLGTPKDVGMAVAFLASDAARYITAVELKVDGGLAVSL